MTPRILYYLNSFILDIAVLSEYFKILKKNNVLKSKILDPNSSRFKEYSNSIINSNFIYQTLRTQRDLGTQLFIIYNELSSDCPFVIGWLFYSILILEHYFFVFSELQKTPKIPWSILYKIKWELRLEMLNFTEFNFTNHNFDVKYVSDLEIMENLLNDLRQVILKMEKYKLESVDSTVDDEGKIKLIEENHLLEVKLKVNYRSILEQHMVLGYHVLAQMKTAFDCEWVFLGWAVITTLVIEDFKSKTSVNTVLSDNELLKLKWNLLLRSFDEHLFGLQSGRSI